ncbi:MAG: hypothetical protein COV60_03130 [Candidatus Magasanikbacteria bacterium CG11_big_fil_rev_8_21_14_0_20_43_7]|uniref:Uncharacterized protein n=1 Tax=Candidatus Magasanikbacteria bacterium CG11_big_fil_rev_8_21_14_0_20_43_7 TaxID=1974654 RepID=A0A2H0N1Z4_9BACT|nr:MAG: hypothetical protein COV60_03130 [Candidatus Magasanikbacteria bacterium CG11_big_fil_rev_8_21_14_0_20_43_7]
MSRRPGARRIAGRVNADFLPVTSSRDDFLRDTDEFRVFDNAMRKEVDKLLISVKKEGDNKANLQASRVLKDAMHLVGNAMRRRKELFPAAQVPFGEADAVSSKQGYDVSQATYVDAGSQLDSTLANRLGIDKKKKQARGRPSAVLGDKSVIRHLRVANMDVAVRMEHLGADEDESLRSGGIIFLNLDHPLYTLYRDNDELLSLHLTRVLTKEITLSIGDVSAPQAFAIQSELLTDALRRKRKSI